nr:hypothetical protein CFP56_76837 [Quercus suber]
MAQRRRGRRGGIRGNQMDVGEGVEAKPPVGRNVGRNQNIEREDMIAELRRQVAALTEVVQRMQPSHETTDKSDDSHSHFENPFGAPPRAGETLLQQVFTKLSVDDTNFLQNQKLHKKGHHPALVWPK